jgi:hypothetical protein
MATVAPFTLGYQFNILSGPYTQPFYVDVFLGKDLPQVDYETAKNVSSFVGSQYISPMMLEHSLASGKGKYRLESRRWASGHDSDSQEQSRHEKAVERSGHQSSQPIDEAFVAAATAEAVGLTDRVKTAIGGTINKYKATQYLEENLSWKLFGSKDHKELNAIDVPVKLWVTEVEWIGPAFHNTIIWPATNGKPGALREGESLVIEADSSQFFALPEADDDADAIRASYRGRPG